MICPKCKSEMKIKNSDISNNLKKGDEYREYERTICWCTDDDIWISVEIPRIS